MGRGPAGTGAGLPRLSATAVAGWHQEWVGTHPAICGGPARPRCHGGSADDGRGYLRWPADCGLRVTAGEVPGHATPTASAHPGSITRPRIWRAAQCSRGNGRTGYCRWRYHRAKNLPGSLRHGYVGCGQLRLLTGSTSSTASSSEPARVESRRQRPSRPGSIQTMACRGSLCMTRRRGLPNPRTPDRRQVRWTNRGRARRAP